jgi:hypothetical protein
VKAQDWVLPEGSDVLHCTHVVPMLKAVPLVLLQLAADADPLLSPTAGV